MLSPNGQTEGPSASDQKCEYFVDSPSFQDTMLKGLSSSIQRHKWLPLACITHSQKAKKYISNKRKPNAILTFIIAFKDA